MLEELFSNTRLNFLYFLVEFLVQLLLSGTSPVLTLFTTVQLISFDISPHCSALLYSLIERCCAPAYKVTPKMTPLSCQTSYIAIAPFQPANHLRVRTTVPAY